MRKHLLLSVAILLLLCACSNKKNEPSSPNEEEMQQRFNDYITYVSGNYEPTDILLFETEDGKSEELIVTTSYTIAAIETAGDKANCYGTGIFLATYKTEETTIKIYIEVLNLNETYSVVEISCNREIPTDGIKKVDIPTPSENQILLQDKSGWCLLERNVGIIQMADTSGHTWVLKTTNEAQ